MSLISRQSLHSKRQVGGERHAGRFSPGSCRTWAGLEGKLDWSRDWRDTTSTGGAPDVVHVQMSVLSPGKQPVTSCWTWWEVVVRCSRTSQSKKKRSKFCMNLITGIYFIILLSWCVIWAASLSYKHLTYYFILCFVWIIVFIMRTLWKKSNCEIYDWYLQWLICYIGDNELYYHNDTKKLLLLT